MVCSCQTCRLIYSPFVFNFFFSSHKKEGLSTNQWSYYCLFLHRNLNRIAQEGLSRLMLLLLPDVYKRLASHMGNNTSVIKQGLCYARMMS